MTHRPMIIAVLSSLLAACAKDDGEHRIIGAANRDSASYCSSSRDGCEFSVTKTPDGSGVIAFPITRAENGERIYIPGMFRSYSYEEHGNLLGEMPGV